MATFIRLSPLHRRLGLSPGDCPTWVCATTSCENPDLFIGAEVALFILPGLLGVSMWWYIPVVIAVGIFVGTVHMPFESTERFAKARRRRGECRWCGHTHVAVASHCSACGNIT